MFNGLDIHKTRDYVKISCETYIMDEIHPHCIRPTYSASYCGSVHERFLKGNGDPTQTVQDRLAEMMGLKLPIRRW